jgi:redox-sensitive bicupin YhaK (pirin superfamily)
MTRRIVHRTRGQEHGPIVRLMSPSDLGEELKPFVFLDLFEADMRALAGSMPVHPHSGIATVTVFADGDVIPHAHPLHLGSYSVHTSAEALAAGERHIRSLKQQLDAAGDRRTRSSGSTPVFRG